MLVILGGWAAWTLWDGRQPASVESAPVAREAVPTPPPAPPAGAAPAPSGSELTTTRPVWVRVIADGERVLERELPADTRVPLKAEKTIVIRTGDAGAVTVSIDGKDQGPLGRAGEVVTRTFTLQGGTPR